MWTPVPTTESTRPKVRSVPTTCAVVSEVRPKKATVPSAPAPEEEKPTSAAMGKVISPIHFGRSVAGPDDGVGTKVAKQLPAGGKDDDGAEHDVKQRFGAVLRDMVEEERTQDHSGDAAEQHPEQDAVGDLLAHNLDRNHDQLDDRCIGQGGAHRDLHRHMKK